MYWNLSAYYFSVSFILQCYFRFTVTKLKAFVALSFEINVIYFPLEVEVSARHSRSEIPPLVYFGPRHPAFSVVDFAFQPIPRPTGLLTVQFHCRAPVLPVCRRLHKRKSAGSPSTTSISGCFPSALLLHLSQGALIGTRLFFSFFFLSLF